MPRKRTTKEFIEKAKEKHGNKYDYSKVEYKNNKTKVSIICKKHGDFKQTPDSHLRGGGCPTCGGNYRPTTKEFIKKAKEKHGNKYDYSKVKYNGAHKKVIIICKEHDEFKQTPGSHLNGNGCPTCGIELRAKKISLTTDEFIEKAKEKHGNKYDYSKVKYNDAHKKVIIICKEHDEFKQTPGKHLSGNGCPTCSGNIKLTTEGFIEKAKKKHGNKYDYSKVDYINNRKKVIIICKEHGEFKQSPGKHLSGNGCPTCANILSAKKQSSTTEGFIEKAKKKHGNKYDYSKVKYNGAHKKVIIICKDHGEFKQTPGKHLSGNGCPTCSGHIKLTTEGFIEKAKKKHGNKYDYSKVKYNGAHKKVIIICKDHGEFKQTPGSHLTGKGWSKCSCPSCSGNIKLTTEEFIEKAQVKHGNKYDYSKVEYINNHTKVIIICIEHGEFKQTPGNHLSGKGCFTCSNILNAKKLSSTTEEFIKKAKKVHGDTYDYSKANYINNRKKVIIICKDHGEFKQQPNNHLNGNGCPTCNKCPKCELWRTMGRLCAYCKPKN
jgi:ribosomal protein L36